MFEIGHLIPFDHELMHFGHMFQFIHTFIMEVSSQSIQLFQLETVRSVFVVQAGHVFQTVQLVESVEQMQLEFHLQKIEYKELFIM